MDDCPFQGSEVLAARISHAAVVQSNLCATKPHVYHSMCRQTRMFLSPAELVPPVRLCWGLFIPGKFARRSTIHSADWCTSDKPSW